MGHLIPSLGDNFGDQAMERCRIQRFIVLALCKIVCYPQISLQLHPISGWTLHLLQDSTFGLCCVPQRQLELPDQHGPNCSPELLLIDDHLCNRLAILHIPSPLHIAPFSEIQFHSMNKNQCFRKLGKIGKVRGRDFLGLPSYSRCGCWFGDLNLCLFSLNQTHLGQPSRFLKVCIYQ